MPPDVGGGRTRTCTGWSRHERWAKAAADDVLAAAADALLTAERDRQPIEPISSRWPSLTPGDAYAIQHRIVATRINDGAVVRGRKIGLTSAAMQRLSGIDEPDYGHLFEDMFVLEGTSIATASLVQPRIEAEIAFVLAKPLGRSPTTIVDVFAATEAVLPALEVIDSRIVDWSIKLVDTIADNGSAARVVLGGRPRLASDFDPQFTPAVLYRNGVVVATGVSAGVFGNPLASVAWLADALIRLGSPLEAGEIVLSGSMTTAVAAEPGDQFVGDFGPLGRVAVTFA